MYHVYAYIKGVVYSRGSYMSQVDAEKEAKDASKKSGVQLVEVTFLFGLTSRWYKGRKVA